MGPKASRRRDEDAADGATPRRVRSAGAARTQRSDRHQLGRFLDAAGAQADDDAAARRSRRRRQGAGVIAGRAGNRARRRVRRIRRDRGRRRRTRAATRRVRRHCRRQSAALRGAGRAEPDARRSGVVRCRPRRRASGRDANPPPPPPRGGRRPVRGRRARARGHRRRSGRARRRSGRGPSPRFGPADAAAGGRIGAEPPRRARRAADIAAGDGAAPTPPEVEAPHAATRPPPDITATRRRRRAVAEAQTPRPRSSATPGDDARRPEITVTRSRRPSSRRHADAGPASLRSHAPPVPPTDYSSPIAAARRRCGRSRSGHAATGANPEPARAARSPKRTERACRAWRCRPNAGLASLPAVALTDAEGIGLRRSTPSRTARSTATSTSR